MHVRIRRPATVAAVAAVATAALAGCGGGSGRAHRATVTPRPVPQPRSATRLALGRPGRTVPRGYLGLSIEFQAIRAYTGTDPAAIDPVFEALVRQLSPGQSPTLRIGGDSTDISWYGPAGATAPAHAKYRLTPSWLATTAGLAHAIDARMILGLNLAGDDPASDAAEAAADVKAFGSTLAGFEIGNEPNLYAGIDHVRPMNFSPAPYRREIHTIVSALPASAAQVPLVGPALSAGPDPAGTGPWLTEMAALLKSEPRVRTLSIHRYPLKRCFLPPSSPQFPTIARLLSSDATVSLADSIHRWVAIARAQGVKLRVDELNSAACRGRPGVSDTFASSLWVTDALFSLLHAGVDAVNIHTLPDSAYELFQFSRHDGRWRSWVRPVYYGLQLFAQATPVGSRLVDVAGATHTPRLSVWATTAPDHSERLVLINKDPGRAETVELPAPPGAHGTVTVERLTAPNLRATGHVTLGGRGYGRETDRGTLRAPRVQPPGRAPNGDYVITVPGASAAMVTFGAS